MAYRPALTRHVEAVLRPVAVPGISRTNADIVCQEYVYGPGECLLLPNVGVQQADTRLSIRTPPTWLAIQLRSDIALDYCIVSLS